MVQRQFPTLYDMLLAHAHARGKLVMNPDHADTIYDTSDRSGVNVYDLETILAMI
jgi:hypothetical protein